MSFGEVFERYNVSYGLANNVVYDVAEDKYGFMWVTTRNGISRFDGSDFVTYRPVPPGVQGQVAQSYLKIYPDRNGNLWFCSWGNGLLRLDVDTEQFTFFRHDPNDPETIAGNEVWFAFEDRDGMIWVSSLGGLSQLNPATGKAHVYRHDPTNLNSLSDNLPMQVVQDAAGELWIGTYGGGLDRFDLKTQTFAHYRHRKGIANSLIDDRIEGLFLDRDGTLWIATNGGLDHFDPASGRFTGYKHDPNDPGSLSNDVVMQATRDSRGRIWTSNLGGGIHRLDEATGKFTHYGYDPANPRGPSMNLCLYFRESRDGAMWFASANGLNRYDEQGGRFQPLLRQPGQPGARGDIAVSGAQQDRQGRLWITSDDVGLVRYDPVKRQYRQYAPEAGNPHSLSNVSATSITMDPAGAIWIGTRAGFNRYDAATDQFERFTVARYGSGGTALDNIPDITADRQGVIWLAIYGLGLQRFDPKRQAFTLFNHKANDPASLGNDQASVVRVGSDGSVWVGCDAGLSRLDPASGKFTNFAAGQDGLSSIIINAIAEAPGGAMLFGTDVGVDVYDTRAKRFTAYTVREGMPSNYVMALQSDQAGNIWAGTDKGLVRIDTRSGKIRVYDVNDGLPSNQFWNHAAYRAPDGTMYFGGMNGLAFFRPELLRDNPVPPPVYITGFSLFNRKVVPGPGSPLKTGILVTKAVTLDYRQSSLSFRFAALNYRWSKKNQYAYKLEGFDDGWTAVDSSKREAVYTNLSPGHYVFHVKASNNDGVWNEAGTSLTITITPPWWQTGSFRSLWVAAFLALLWTAYRMRVRQLRRQERKLRDVIETIPTFAWTALPDGSVDFVNLHWQEYTGLSAERTVGSGWQAAVHAADLKRHTEKWLESLETGDPFESEVRYRRAADEQYRWFLARAVPLRDQRGKILKWYGISTDIEDRKRAEEDRERLRADLAHVNRVSTLGEMAASLAHEIKQPIAASITSANSCIEWLAHEPPNLDRARAAAGRIDKYGNRAAEIIDRIRSLYKKSPPQRELVEVNEIIREMVELLRGEANLYAVSIRTDLVADPPKIMADRVQLRQVFMNLILNAIEAMKETGGVLTIKTQLAENGQLLISVSDSGVGLPKEKIEQIFDAFFTTKPQGSGMGLSISRSIVESHRGRLWATANNGRGATFHFTLPSEATAASTSAV